MNIHAPEEVAAADAPAADVVVNVFAGSGRSKVELRLGEAGEWRPMEKVSAADPFYLAMKELEAGPTPPPGRKLPAPAKSTHLWKAKLAADSPAPGTHLIHVRTTDMFGRTYEDRRAVRVAEGSPAATSAPAPAAGN